MYKRQPLYRRCLDRLNFLELMDGGYMSWQVHLLKPEPEMYRKLIQDFQITPEKAVFIDDYMDNVAEARAQGLNAIHFTGRKSAVDVYKRQTLSCTAGIRVEPPTNNT